MHEVFRKIAQETSKHVGSPWAFAFAFIVVVGWAVSGPFFDFSNTWQLVINTSTTILTFLMVFLIQNTQNRDAQAIHLKLDELIRAQSDASDLLIDVEDETDAKLEQLQKRFVKFRDDSPDSMRKEDRAGN